MLLVAERRKGWSVADSARFISLLSRLPIVVENEHPERLLRDLLGLARAQRLSSYDASYLDLAMKNGFPLATLDKKLRKAAASVKVAILS